MNMPKDPVILLSYVNTQLRDFYPSLDEFCKSCNISPAELSQALSVIDYQYNETTNQFI